MVLLMSRRLEQFGELDACNGECQLCLLAPGRLRDTGPSMTSWSTPCCGNTSSAKASTSER